MDIRISPGVRHKVIMIQHLDLIISAITTSFTRVSNVQLRSWVYSQVYRILETHNNMIYHRSDPFRFVIRLGSMIAQMLQSDQRCCMGLAPQLSPETDETRSNVDKNDHGSAYQSCTCPDYFGSFISFNRRVVAVRSRYIQSRKKPTAYYFQYEA